MKQPKCPKCGGTGNVASGKQMRALRKEAGLTLEQVAKKMGIQFPHLSDLERGRRDWNHKLEAKFRKAVGCL